MRRRRWREIATARNSRRPAWPGDPVFRDIGNRTVKPRRTGYSAFAGYDDQRCGAHGASHQTHSSYAGLTRVSINLHESLAKRMDGQVKPGHDDLSNPTPPPARAAVDRCVLAMRHRSAAV